MKELEVKERGEEESDCECLMKGLMKVTVVNQDARVVKTPSRELDLVVLSICSKYSPHTHHLK